MRVKARTPIPPRVTQIKPAILVLEFLYMYLYVHFYILHITTFHSYQIVSKIEIVWCEIHYVYYAKKINIVIRFVYFIWCKTILHKLVILLHCIWALTIYYKWVCANKVFVCVFEIAIIHNKNKFSFKRLITLNKDVKSTCI